MTDTFRVFLDGVYYPGFTDGQVSISIEEAASNFSLTFPERWRSAGVTLPFGKGSKAEIFLAETMVLSGAVDVLHLNRDRESGLMMRISGRSNVRNVVDSSAIFRGGVWKNRTVIDIARDLCNQVDVPVEVDPAIIKDPVITTPLTRHSIERGEKIYECIERALRSKGVLTTSNLKGNLYFIRPGTVIDEGPIAPGEYEILNVDYEESENERFSEYIFKVQVFGNDKWNGNLSRGGISVVRDPDVKGKRPFIVLSESYGNSGNLRNRASWERNVRAGRSAKLSYDIAGWRTNSGTLWMPNRMKRVQDEYLGIDQDLLITRVTWMCSRERGLHTGLELTNKDAFDVLRPAPKAPRKRRSIRDGENMFTPYIPAGDKTAIDTEFFSTPTPSNDLFTRNPGGYGKL